MEYSFNYTIALNVKFTDDEFNLLDEAIKQSEYKREAELGGFWYGANIRRNLLTGPERQDIDMDFTFRQLDKLTKTLEPYINYLSDDFARALYKKIANTLHAVNTEYEALSLVVDQEFKQA